MAIPMNTLGHRCTVNGNRGTVTALQYEADRTLMDVAVETPGPLTEDGDGQVVATIYLTTQTIAMPVTG